jgi:enoyl-CoA hydratase
MSDVVVETDGAVMVVAIDRPSHRNAMTLAAAEVIAAAFTELDAREDLRVGILTGRGGTFCAGMDLKRFALGERPYVPGAGFGGLTERVVAKPVIAAVEGWALGGGFELVLACDLVCAGESARFGLPEVKVGLVARGGGMIRLPRRVPRAMALEMLLTGEPVTAQRAADAGLVNHVVPDGSALDRALALAAVVAANSPLAVRTSKAVALGVDDLDGFERQRPLSDAVFASADAAEGAQAFAQKRPPVWRGR